MIVLNGIQHYTKDELIEQWKQKFPDDELDIQTILGGYVETKDGLFYWFNDNPALKLCKSKLQNN